MPRRIVLYISIVILFVGAIDGMAQRRGRRGQGRFSGPGSGAPVDIATVPRTESEEKILKVIGTMVGNREMQSVPTEDGRLLRLLVESTNAQHVVEIGTSHGYSGLWICMALQTTGGKLTTFEIDPKRASLARQHFKQAGVDELVTLIEGDAHKNVMEMKEPIDVLFIDADKKGYLDYLNKLLPYVRAGGLVLSHNISSPAPDPEYVKAISTNPDLETIILNGNVGVTLNKRK